MDHARFARQALAHCHAIANFSEEPGVITRTFLSAAMRDCHAYLSRWMERAGMCVQTDAAGNLRGLYPGRHAGSSRIIIGSHLDSVPNAGAFDGVLGVVIGVTLVEMLRGEHLPFAIEVIGFSDEEGVRFGGPFLGSRALAGTLDRETLQVADRSGTTMEEAIRHFGLDPSQLCDAKLGADARAYIEFHIEQGPVLESIDTPIAAVDAIAGQSRAMVTFRGRANHAGTTPMRLRRDALCGAAEWIMHVEEHARPIEGMVATVGKIEAKPGATNVVPGEVSATLDVRHAVNSVRREAFEALIAKGCEIARERGLTFDSSILLDQNAIVMDRELTRLCEQAIQAAGVPVHRISSGAGHDAMILAPKLSSAMMFLRSPGGISHHPDESVEEQDVAAALSAGLHLLRNLSL